MKKNPLFMLCFFAGLALIAYVALSFLLGSVVKTGIHKFGPRITQTTIELQSAQISPFTGSGTLTGLTVGNPEGWSSKRAFYFGKIHVDVQPFSIFEDRIVINELVIDQPEFTYETKIISSNLNALLKNIEEFTDDDGKKTADKNRKPLKFIITKFRLTNGTAKLGVGPAAIPVPLPDLSLENLGTKENGLTADQLAGVIMQGVLADVVTASGKAAIRTGGTLGAGAGRIIGGAAEKTSEGIKKLFGK